ncbi:hypothetical protein EVAR_3895_1 [Eumeta japonica]|uniref:Uncharacterized protein n=1 Tax=Eumeta variegata TaxID=151549 RepID=A0A4C1SQM8_EUMVA|nr:hypothetical protein EVAR_3895_1 [Eumeta japonica]
MFGLPGGAAHAIFKKPTATTIKPSRVIAHAWNAQRERNRRRRRGTSTRRSLNCVHHHRKYICAVSRAYRYSRMADRSDDFEAPRQKSLTHLPAG